MSELDAIVLAQPGAEALASVDCSLPTAFLPVSPHGLYDAASATVNGQAVSALAAPPLAAREYLRALSEVTEPSQLPEGVLLLCTDRRDLSLTTPSPFGFDFHWLREAAAGILRGTTGLRLDAAGEATLSATLSGRFTAAVMRDTMDGEPGLRLVVSNAQKKGVQLKAAVTARAEVSLPEGPDELLESLLGTHPLQWARETLKEVGSRRFTQFAEECGATPALMDRLLEAWQTFGVRAEAAIWRALKSAETWGQFREWTAWLNSDAAGEAALLERIQRALESNPAFGTTHAARWLEAVAGAALSEERFTGGLERLRAAAGVVEKLAAQPVVEGLMRQLPAKAAEAADAARLAPWVRERLGELLGEAPGAGTLERMVAPWKQLRDRAYAASREALANKLKAEISLLMSREGSDESLADATFRFTPEGLERFRRVLAGDLAPLFEKSKHVRLRRGALTHRLQRVRHVEIHLPFLDRRDYLSRRDEVARAEVVATPGGGLAVDYSARAAGVVGDTVRQSSLIFSAAVSARDGATVRDNFSLAFSDRRKVSASTDNAAWMTVLDAYGIARPELGPEACEATLALSAPGTFAEAWSTAPHSRDEQFFPVMCRVSRAVQAMSRRWLPALYLSGPESYHTPAVVHALIAWQCSQPYTGIKRGQFGYDVMDAGAVEKALRSSMRTLPGMLASIRQMLLAAGNPVQASYYDPRDARYILSGVLCQRRHFTSLLTADNCFVEEVLRMADCARELRSMAATNPKAAVRNLARYSGAVVDAFQSRLRRLYAQQDFLALGPLFLMEATAALCGHTSASPSIAASLTMEGAGGTVITHNAAARIGV